MSIPPHRSLRGDTPVTLSCPSSRVPHRFPVGLTEFPGLIVPYGKWHSSRTFLRL